jgi:hypothetical protein
MQLHRLFVESPLCSHFHVFIVHGMCPLLLCTFVYCGVVLYAVLFSSVAGYLVCWVLLHYHCHWVKINFQSNNNNNNKNIKMIIKIQHVSPTQGHRRVYEVYRKVSRLLLFNCLGERRREKMSRSHFRKPIVSVCHVTPRCEHALFLHECFFKFLFRFVCDGWQNRATCLHQFLHEAW